MTKYIYRITYQLLGEKYKHTPPSNIFLRAFNLEHARSDGDGCFKKQLAQYGIADADFKMEVRLSCQSEVDAYVANIKNGSTTQCAVN